MVTYYKALALGQCFRPQNIDLVLENLDLLFQFGVREPDMVGGGKTTELIQFEIAEEASLAREMGQTACDGHETASEKKGGERERMRKGGKREAEERKEGEGRADGETREGGLP